MQRHALASALLCILALSACSTVGDEQAAIQAAHQAPGLVEARPHQRAVAHAAVAVTGQQAHAGIPVESGGRRIPIGRVSRKEESGRHRQGDQHHDNGQRRPHPGARRAAAPVQSSTRQKAAFR